MTNTTAKTLILSSLPLFLLPLNAQAQIAADETTSTTVTPTDTGVQIDNGDRSGGNLFHSFQDFSVPMGTEAYFNNASDVANIFSRVTGGNKSNINGLIRANDTANLFLINPNGIIFGKNASLNIGGSFFATTADSISFEDNVAFSASDPTTPLLTSSIPIGANFRDNPGNIDITGSTLEVNQDKTLAFIGGNFNSNAANLKAPGGHIELGGLLQAGTVGIEETEGQFRFNFPSKEIARANVLLTNSNFVDVRSDGGGSITINAGNIDIQNGSELNGGFANNQGSLEAQAGDIILNATGDITLATTEDINNSTGGSIFNNVERGSQGNAGTIIIDADSLSLEDAAQIQTLVRGANNENPAGEGNAGNIEITVNNAVTITGEDSEGLASLISSEVLDNNPENTSNGGDITINAGSLFITRNDNQISKNLNKINTSTSSEGIPGNINIKVTGSLEDRAEVEIFNSEIISQSNSSSTDNNAFSTIDIAATEGSIKIENATIRTSNSNTGLAGDIVLNARDQINIISIENSRSDIKTNGNSGRIFIGSHPDEQVTPPSNVIIKGKRTPEPEPENPENDDPRSDSIFTTNLSVTNLGRDDGLAGAIEIFAIDEINVFGSRLESDTQITNLNRNDPEINDNFSTVRLQVLKDNFDGKIILDQAEINNTNFKIGFAGNIFLNAPNSIEIKDSQLLADGRSGRIFIGQSEIGEKTFLPQNVAITDESVLTATNSYVTESEFVDEQIDAGNIFIDANQDITIDNNSTISNITTRLGNAGNIALNAGNSLLLDNSKIQSNVFALAKGDAGNISINANSISLSSASVVENIVADFDEEENFFDDENNLLTPGIGNAGNIAINVSDSLSLQDGSQFKSDTLGNGNPGTVTIEGRDNRLPIVSFDGNIVINNQSVLSGISTIASTATGNRETSQKNNDGDIFINARSLSMADAAAIQTSTSGNLDAGDVEITVDESLNLSDGSEIIAITRVDDAAGNNATGNAGNVTVEVRNENGFITLDGVAPVKEILPVGGFSSGLFSTTEAGSTGNGGSINITTSNLNILNSAAISTRSRSDRVGGDILIDANNLEIRGGGQILAAAFNSGNAGNINVNVTNKILIEGFDGNFQARLDQIEELINTGGITQENADFTTDTIEDGRSGILASSTTGSSGNIEILTNSLALNNNSLITSATRSGIAGSVAITNENNTSLETFDLNNSQITVTSGDPDDEAIIGTAGNIFITTNDLLQDGGEINANTQRSGANINLSIDNDWRLENESLVSANADGRGNTMKEISKGGNININRNLDVFSTLDVVKSNINENSELLIFAFSSSPQGNDITASATDGADGGQINLRAAGVFGIRERETRDIDNGLNDFDVSSDFGNDGVVEIDTFEDPSSSLVELPASVGDASDTISQNPCEQGVGSEFLVTGKGGFPINPQNNFSSNDMRVGLVEPVPTENQTATVENSNISSTEEPEIIPAQGWVFNDEGKVILTAYDSTQTGVQRQQNSLTGCPVPQSQAQRDN